VVAQIKDSLARLPPGSAFEPAEARRFGRQLRDRRPFAARGFIEDIEARRAELLGAALTERANREAADAFAANVLPVVRQIQAGARAIAAALNDRGRAHGPRSRLARQHGAYSLGAGRLADPLSTIRADRDGAGTAAVGGRSSHGCVAPGD
jgi:hypothetical protein